MKHLKFIGLFIFLIACSNSITWDKYQSDSAIDKNFNDYLNDYLLHFNNGDASKMYNLLTPEMKNLYYQAPHIETEQDAINLLDSIYNSINSRYAEAGYDVKIENLGIRNRYKCRDDLIFTAEYVMIFKPTRNINQSSSVMGISKDNGKTWQFIESSGTSEMVVELYSDKYGKENLIKYIAK